MLDLRQLVVMGGKQCLGAQLSCVGGVFQHRPGDGHAVVGGGTPADLVQNQKTSGGGVFQNVRHLRHLHHEGGLTGGQVVAGADSGEHPVHHTHPGGLGRHEGADLGHDDHEGHLAHIGGFTGHVGAGQNGHLVAGATQIGVVGYKEGVGQHLLHHGVASGLDDDLRPVGDFRTAVAPLGRHRCQGTQHVYLRHGGGGLLNPARLHGHKIPHPAEQVVFQSHDPVPGRKNVGFQLL